MKNINIKQSLAVFAGCSLLGPLVGGAPYNWMFWPIPISYVFGGLPSIVGAGLFATWLCGKPVPEVSTATLYGAASGMIGAVLGSTIQMFIWYGMNMQAPFVESTGFAVIVNLPHGALAGAVLGGCSTYHLHRALSKTELEARPK